MYILGVNAYHPDASAAILLDGKLVAAVEEERFTRVKHTAGFPANAVRYCLDAAGITIQEVDHIAIPRNPRVRLLNKLVYAARIPRLAMDRAKALSRFMNMKEELASSFDVGAEEIKAQWHKIEHHRAHLASSFFVSPFDKAALLSLDGLGDFASGMWGIGEGNKIRVLGSVAFPHSIGMYYTAVTQYLGFWKFGDEYKVMGLAAFGEPEYMEMFRDVIHLRNGMGYKLGLDYFSHHKFGPSLTWTEGEPVLGQLFSDDFETAFGSQRERNEGIESRHKNLASSLQKRLEEIVFHQWRNLRQITGLNKLSYAGGVAFNCVANGKIFDETDFEDLYIQSAAGDAGLAIGAAFYVWHQVLDNPRSFVMDHALWGPEYSDTELKAALKKYRITNVEYRIEKLREDQLVSVTAEHIAEGKVVGWFQGRSEWGPRALGNRSIVVDPRRHDMRDILNSRIKHREPFRPFAPSILEEYTGDYFEKDYPSPYMLMAYPVKHKKRSEIPAPTHVDGTGRLQTVNKETNPRYWKLINAFREITGVPVVLNTSFNENEPIVNTPDQAIDCFLRTKMDVLVIGNFLIEK